jgi:Family of unknown function (DUF6441)
MMPRLAFQMIFDRDGFDKALKEAQAPIQEAATAAVAEAAEEAVRLGRANIAAGGRFGMRWQSGLKFKTYDKDPGNPKVNAVALVYHANPMAGVFQHGATIRGKRLLWLPLEPNAGGASSPKRYGRQLVSVNVAGKPPMLFDKFERKPVFVGVEQVTLKKRWHIIEIVERTAKRLGEFFVRNFKQG